MTQKKNYKGFVVEVFNTGFKEIDNKKAVILNQYKSDRDGLIFEINKSNPKSKKNEPLCITENQCKIQ